MIFPSSPMHRLLRLGTEDGLYRGLIEAAKKWVARWHPQVAVEIDFFIREYALTYEDFSKLPYRSLDAQPGHIRIAPLLLMLQAGQRYERGSEIEPVLVAAQLIHESRHQKGFYFNRVTDPRPILYPSHFVKRRFHRTVLALPFGAHWLSELFD